MATPGAKPLGVTAPLSSALPTEAENQASVALIEELKRQNNYESTAETNKRAQILQSLQSITEEFVRSVSRAQGVSENTVKSAGGKIVTFGSFKLGVIGPGSDIDTLVVGPKNITHEDFFKTFPEILLKMAPEGAIDELTLKPEAFVPVITLKYSGVDIDLLYGRIAGLSQIPRDLSLLDMNLLRGLSDTEVRSLNGVRVADEILNLVPQQAVFRTALRVVKLWGTRRAIAGNIFGFPGGVAWAVLVARVCQLYPKATSSTIVLKFFRIMEKWQWPMPVLLKPIENGTLGLKTWNPKLYPSDRNHLMPIITPAYPSMCTTHNFSKSTKEILHRELKRGGNITDQIMLGKAQWKELFAKHSFFTAGCKYYLAVISASTTKDALLIWSGFVESKVRLLVSKLEDHQSIALAYPFNKGFVRAHRCSTEEEVENVKGGSLKYHATDIATTTSGHGLALEPLGKDGALDGDKKVDQNDLTMVYTTTHYIGLELQEGAKTLDLAWQVDDFKRTCTSWDNYDHEVNALSIVHIRNYDLPDDVFAEGEVKPARPQKKKTANGTSKKRVASDSSTPAAAKRQQTTAVAAG